MRQERIDMMEKYILRSGSVSINQLMEEFNVSANTVRRDLENLINRGNIRKIYGGVSAVQERMPVPMAVRAQKNQDAKVVIGKMASELVWDNSAIFLDSGSTTMSMLPYLSQKKNITVISHSLAALYEASKYPGLNIVSLGGIYSPSTYSFVGMSTVEQLSRISVDLAFMAATGVSIQHGLTNSTYMEAEIKRAVTQRSNSIVLMADHSKFGHFAPFTFCDLSALSAVVTDIEPKKDYLELFSRAGIKLYCG